MIKRGLFLVLASLMFLGGCGYTTGSLLPENYQVIYVGPFENKIDYLNQDERKIYIPGLETRVRANVIDRYLFDGNLRLGEKDTADLVLEGQLLSFEREELRLSTNEDVREYRLRITVALKVTDPVEQKVMWEEPAFAGEATYYVSGPLAKSETAAIDEALKDLANRIVARTIEDW